MTIPRYIDCDAWYAYMVGYGLPVKVGGKRLHTVPALAPDGSRSDWCALFDAFKAGPVSLILREPWKPAPDDWAHRYYFQSNLFAGGAERVVAFREKNGLDPLPCFTGPWLPAAEMPDDAATIRLNIKSIVCRHLHDADENDACDEGVWRGNVAAPPDYLVGYRATHGAETIHPLAVPAFREAWDARHGAGNWDSNPPVFVISFRAFPINSQVRVTP